MNESHLHSGILRSELFTVILTLAQARLGSFPAPCFFIRHCFGGRLVVGVNCRQVQGHYTGLETRFRN